MDGNRSGRGASAPRHLLVPHGLDLWEVLPARLRRHHHVDGAKLILHRVVTGSMKSARDDRFAGMSYEEAAVLADGWRTWEAMSDAFQDKGVLECDGRAEIGIKSFGWRLTDRWEAAPIERYIPRDPAVLGRLAEADAKARANRKDGPSGKARLPAHDHYQGWVERLALDDGDAALAVARIEPENQRSAAKAAAAIGSGDPAVRVAWPCDHGRLHHILTMTYREIREACTIGEECLADVDVSNAQPLLCGINAAEWWTTTHKPKMIRGKKEDENDDGRRMTAGTSNTNTTPRSALVDARLSSWSTYPSDLIDYLSACVAGRFYEELAEVLGLREAKPRGGRPATSKRDRAKGQSNFLIMGDPLPNAPPWLRFAKRWPTVAGYLRWVKRDDYSHSSHALQRKESDIMIGEVGSAMLRDHPGIPAVPIHDGILTPPWAAELVADVIRRAWMDRAGVHVPLKIKCPA